LRVSASTLFEPSLLNAQIVDNPVHISQQRGRRPGHARQVSGLNGLWKEWKGTAYFLSSQKTFPHAPKTTDGSEIGYCRTQAPRSTTVYVSQALRTKPTAGEWPRGSRRGRPSLASTHHASPHNRLYCVDITNWDGPAGVSRVGRGIFRELNAASHRLEQR
jgi:hypothetical protein